MTYSTIIIFRKNILLKYQYCQYQKRTFQTTMYIEKSWDGLYAICDNYKAA